MEEDWDVLLILDACRYDFFEKICGEYFEGKLERRLSVDFCTLSWAIKSFQGHYPDVIYVSGTPYISSKHEFDGFRGSKHFNQVIDVWEYGWQEGLGVHPRIVTESAIKVLRTFNSKRVIIHYLQPHTPYISNELFRELWTAMEKMPVWILMRVEYNLITKNIDKIINILSFLFSRVGLLRERVALRILLGQLFLGNPVKNFARKYGIEILRIAYEQNLRIVMKYAAILCYKILKENPSAKILITSDHGELLGEDGLFGHYNDHIYTRLVPLLRVRNVKISDDSIKKFDKELLRHKIKKLKYKFGWIG
ncbi:MAG: hypothetical protein NZ929_05780 [Aigarchaeota archaeon]|nr:hypothetical protein [Aigarchaeota archaeon]MDW7986878.1 hypothetical protein [Nitrososphaerota archaeon]